MATSRTRLEGIRERCEGAKDGPWETCYPPQNYPAVIVEDDSICYIGFSGVGMVETTEFIAASRADIPALLALAEAVLEKNRRQKRCIFCGDTRVARAYHGERCPLAALEASEQAATEEQG